MIDFIDAMIDRLLLWGLVAATGAGIAVMWLL